MEQDNKPTAKTKKQNRPNLFNDYDAFVAKFETKKTTDDCYTPQKVMDVIVDYVDKNYPLKGKTIVRPFYPGGDYEAIDYTDDMVVIDNPPFSIFAKICRYYVEKKVKFFLFSPHLTAFMPNIDCTHIITGANIVYENGAKIKTAFVSNLFNDLRIIGDVGLRQAIESAQEIERANLPKYEYPANVITVSKVANCVKRGINVTFRKNELMHIKTMDAQKPHCRGLFGGGYLASDKSPGVSIVASGQPPKDKEAVKWELSDREKEIIKSLK
jgi:hypothetical protein